jgi:hypothetical protein
MELDCKVPNQNLEEASESDRFSTAFVWQTGQPICQLDFFIVLIRDAPVTFSKSLHLATTSRISNQMESNQESIAKFNKQVNMTIGELQTWLDGDVSDIAGTSVGVKSGRKIKISKKNPKKDPNGYDQVRF